MSTRSLTILGVIILVLGIIGFSAAFTVHQTEQVLVLQFGEPRRVITEPGLNFKIPFVQNVIRINKRIRAYDGPAEEIIASDQKRLVVDSFTRFRIIDPLLFFQTVGTERGGRARLGALVTASLREVLGEVPLASVLTEERSVLMRQITGVVDAEARALGMQVVDLRIKRADLPDANSQAIYARMKSEREREAREFRAQGAEISQRIRSRADRDKTVLIAEAQKESQILRGEGDAQRNNVFAKAYGQDPEFFAFYRAMLAYETALGSSDTTMVLAPDSEFFRFFQGFSGSFSPRAQ